MSAISKIAHNDNLLQQIFITKEYNDHGIYALKLYIDGVWIGVVVDDRIPCDKDNRPMFVQVR